jgi:hypothetical protein
MVISASKESEMSKACRIDGKGMHYEFRSDNLEEDTSRKDCGLIAGLHWS